MLKLNRFFFDQAISIDNALTTNQIIHQIIKQVKEVVEYVNSLETDAHEYTDTKVLELKTQLEGQISDLETTLKGYTDTKLAEGKTYTDSEIANLRINYIDVKVSEIYETITALGTRLDAKIDLVDATLTNLIGDVRTELIELIKKGNSIIYSGYSGLLTSLQNEINNLYNIISKRDGLTWDIFDLWIKPYNICYEKVYPTVNTNRVFIFDDFIIESTALSNITNMVVIKGAETTSINFVLPLQYSALDTVFFYTSNGGTVRTNSYTLTKDTDETYVYFGMSIDNSVLYKNNYFYFVLAEGTTGRYLFDVHIKPDADVELSDSQYMTWDTLALLQTIMGGAITYNLITYSFWTNIGKAVTGALLDYRRRLAQTYTNYGTFNNNYERCFANPNLLVSNTPCETTTYSLSYDYSEFLKGV